MCGIAGCFGENKDVIEKMTQSLVHRGPDGHKTEIRDGASLGHTRLAILDPSPAGLQPMWNDDNTLGVVFNGEIFNFKALAKKYNLHCKTGTDTEVLLKLYEQKGIDCIKELRGMFAFGIYDVRKRTWTLARDSSGIKPLYTAMIGGKLHFASESRALIVTMKTKPALNLKALSQYIRLQYIPGPETLCEGITTLMPGKIIVATETQIKELSFTPDQADIHCDTKQEFMQNFPPLFDEVVRDHLVSDKPIGMFLSGGMDSSIVLHHMQRHAQKPVRTFTVRFDATEEEDGKRFNTDADLAALTAAHFKTEHHDVLLTAAHTREIYKETAKHLDQPNADSVAPAQFMLSREAKKHVDVVLTGSGGDELFGGYPRYRIAKIIHALRFVPSGIRRLAGHLAGYPSDVLESSPGPRLAERLLARSQAETAAIVKGTWYQRPAVSDLFDAHFARLPHHPVRQFMEFDRHMWLVDESLRLTDAVTMSSGLEARVPFLDPRVIAASHGTDPDWHVGFRRTKALLKDTYLPELPAHLATLGKSSFYPPLAKWIRRECAPLVEEMLAGERINEFFNTDILRVMFEDHKSKTAYNLHALSSLIQLHFWFREVYDA